MQRGLLWGSKAGLQNLLAEVSGLARQVQRLGVFQRGRSGLLLALDSAGPQTVPQIARRLRASRQAIQALVNRLTAQGLVELVENPAHIRSALVQLSSSGARASATEKVRGKRWLEDMAGQVTEAELETATTILSRLNLLLSGSAKEPVARPATDFTIKGGRPAKPRRPRLRTESETPSVTPATEIESPEDFPVNLL
jgi:DNA-binding MarR family transcriptional regulator